MPRYFFDIDDSVTVRDRVGQELADAGAAQDEAYQRAAEYGADPARLRSSGAIVVTVRDEQHALVLRVRLVCQVETF